MCSVIPVQYLFKYVPKALSANVFFYQFNDELAKKKAAMLKVNVQIFIIRMMQAINIPVDWTHLSTVLCSLTAFQLLNFMKWYKINNGI